MNTKKWFWTAWTIVLMTPTGYIVAQTKARVDRTPLTYRDGGLYCNPCCFGHGAKLNMLPAERAASPDSPWSFYICQIQGPARPEDVKLIERMAANGKKVILRAALGGHTGPAPKVEEMERRLVDMLKDLDPDWLYAITLDEERIYWNGWAEALTALYHRAKKCWPDLPVYQWWTPMEVPNVRATSGWVALPADGWVIDLYGQPRVEFEKKLVMTLETGKPVIHIVWSSPDWPDYCGAKSWEDGGRRVFEDQLEICRSYNVPVAHFCTGDRKGSDESIRWGWRAVNPVVRHWYRSIEVLAENNRLLPDAAMGFRTLDKRVFDWAHAINCPQGVSFDLDEEGRKRMCVALDPSRFPLQPGEHLISTGEADRYLKVTCILDDSASTRKRGMGVAGMDGHPVRATITFRIEPQRPVSNMSVTTNVYASSELGGSASVSASADGREWLESVISTPKKPHQALVVHWPMRGGQQLETAGFNKEPSWIRVQLEANSGTKTNTAASLKNIEIAVVVAPQLK